jgi:UDP-N-acetylglucosamine--N-acetylmuramyl-(pentapeptide) pyrophosphoryl-undecaprenol N-acetylglucosamine transferase
MTKKIIEILSKKGEYHLIVIAGKNLEKFECAPNTTLLGFYKNMGYLYSIADLIIARSGALSVAEIASTNKPAVFIPLSTASNNEQRKNVEALMKNNSQFEILDEYKIDEESLLRKIKRVEVLRGANKSAETVFKKQISIIENYV